MQVRDTDIPIDDDSLDWQFEQDTGKLDADWLQVMQVLPAHWQDKALELGAVRRQLRSFSDVATVLRVLFIHLADGCSLRETAARARAGGLVEVSNVALLKRLRRCGPWFQWMTQQLSRTMALPQSKQALLPGRRIRLIDGSTVSEPGASGATWRLHYALNLHTLSCDEVHVTDASQGESLTRYDIQPGDVVMADRGFANRRGLLHVLQHHADVVLRTGLHQIKLHDSQQQSLNLLEKLRELRFGQAGDWQAWLPASRSDGVNSQALAVRVCVYKKTAAQTRAAVQAIEQEARRKKRQVKPETIEAAGYVIVLTTLMQPDASVIMELYRQRWQVELAFKRLKSLLQLGHLKKYDEQGAKAWLQGKLLVACLIEKFILTAEHFSPWDDKEPQEAAPA